MFPSTISGINRLPQNEKREIYTRTIPPEILEYFHISPDLKDPEGRDLLCIEAPEGSSTAEIGLFHQDGFRDPVLYGHITDTVNGQLHILLYMINDVFSPRFDIDCLPDGTSTKMGTEMRNIPAELEAMRAGLAPGQVRKGLRLMGKAIHSFEKFVEDLGHDMYFVDPLYYHNAVIFERYGFSYQKGRKLMEHFQKGFGPNGSMRSQLDNSTPFRSPAAADSIRLRSWAIHDGVNGQPFTDVVMYKRIGYPSDICTCEGCEW